MRKYIGNYFRALSIAGIAVLTAGMISACGGSSQTAGPAAGEAATSAAAEASAPAAETKAAETEANASETKAAAAESAAASDGTSKDADKVSTLGPILVVDYYDSLLTDDGASYGVFQIPEVRLTDEAKAGNIGNAEAALLQYNQYIDQVSQKSVAQLKEYHDDASAGNSAYMSDDIVATIMRADTSVISIYSYEYFFAGGVHPSNIICCRNYDTKTGKLIELDDIVKDKDKLYALIDTKLKEKYPDEYGNLFKNPAEYLKETKAGEDYLWQYSVGYEGLGIFINEEELGPHAMGSMFVNIAYSEAPELFNSDYTEVPEAYVMPLSSRYGSLDADIDADGDGVIENVCVADQRSDTEEGYCSFMIAVGDAVITVDDGSIYEGTPYLVRANDQYYVYIIETSDNDYKLLVCVDLKAMKILDGRLNGSIGAAAYYYNENYTSGYTAWNTFTDPGHFILDSRVDVLSTLTGRKTYKVGSDGAPEPDDAYFGLQTATLLMTKQEVEVEVVDESGKVLSAEKLPKDTYLAFIRSDNKEIVDFQIVDESDVEAERSEYFSFIRLKKDAGDWYQYDPSKPIYRVHRTSDSWPHTVGGVNEEDVFDGIAYAG
ncbi:MAG: hypothetical protein Q4E57_05625 [Eubacteriales bacterium]|nr:hypothetical protein [Eubacteriales bacterium]